jgi:hypothetical protein
MIVPFLLLAMLIVSAVELSQPFFTVMLVLQLAVLASAPLLLVAKGGWRKLLFPQYYYLMNIALLVGYWQFFTMREKYWTKTPRSPTAQ